MMAALAFNEFMTNLSRKKKCSALITEITYLKTQRPVVRFQLEETPTWRTKKRDFTITLSG